MTDTRQPNPALIDTHPLYHLIHLADDVSSAEEVVKEAVRRVRERAESIERDLDRGGDLNRLGELQGSGPALDAAAASLEQACEAFRSGRIYLSNLMEHARLVTDPEVQFAPAIIELVRWFDGIIANSPRARKVWESHS